jgi:hypothetical protein
LLYFVMNSKSGGATIAAKYEKYVERQEEDIALRKKARCHASSEKFTKNYEDLKVPRHPRWRPVIPKPWRLSRTFPEDQESIPKPASLSFSLGGDCLHVIKIYFFGLPNVQGTPFTWKISNRESKVARNFVFKKVQKFLFAKRRIFLIFAIIFGSPRLASIFLAKFFIYHKNSYILHEPFCEKNANMRTFERLLKTS